MTGGPLFRHRVFFGALLCRGALGSKRIPVNVNRLRFAAGRGECAARRGLGGIFCPLNFAREPFAVRFGCELRRRTLAPVTNGLEIERPHQPLIQKGLFRARYLGQVLLGAAPRGRGTLCLAARSGGPLRALPEQGGLTVDAPLPQPMQCLERIAMTHGRSLAKPGRGEGHR